MAWVLIFTIGSIIIVNTPLIYMLFRVHYPSGLFSLWGYAPNQFLFPLLAFPMAAFATFLAMKLLVTYFQQTSSHHPAIQWSTNNWIVVVLIGVILTSLICIADYFKSAKTFDKLQPFYAQKAISSAEIVRETILNFPKVDREDGRSKFIRSWREEKNDIAQTLLHIPNPKEQLADLKPGVYLQIVQDPSLQRKLHLMNPTVHALNVLQLFTAVLTGLCTLFVTGLCYYVFKAESNATQVPVLKNALSAVFFAVTFFALFPILYAQQRAEIEYLVGTGYTILPQVFSGVFAVGLLVALISLEPVKGHLSDVIISRLIPILLIGAGFGFNLIESQPLRQLIGVESNWGIQIILVLCFIVIWVVMILHIWPWKSDFKGMPRTTNVQAEIESNSQ